MPVPSAITDLSKTAGSNYPAGSESPITADDYFRAHASFIALLRDGKGFTDMVTLASGATTDIGGQNAMAVEITGTTTITSFGTTYNGPRFLRFTGALTLTHNATTLYLPGAANITTAAGDTCIALPNSSANGWVVLAYQRNNSASGALLLAGTSANNLVQLNGSAKLPAVDGSLLTGINTTQIQPVSASVGSNALTISASALSLDFRSTTLGSGTVTRVSGTPSNLVISSGSTLGTTSGAPSDIAVLAINNAGTIELAAVNLASARDLSETGVISTTAEGGAGGADSATVIYSTTARTNVAYRVIGILRSTQATAGTWATAPSLIQGVGGQYLPTKLGGTNIANGGFVASTSGTSKEWTNIPPWAKRVTVQLANVSLDASTDLLIQIGNGSYKTTGYESSSCVTGVATTTSTAGFNIYATSASKLSGTVVIERFSNTAIWISSHALSNYASNSPTGGGYQADVGGAGPIDRVKVFSVSGTANFDSGYINVNWE